MFMRLFVLGLVQDLLSNKYCSADAAQSLPFSQCHSANFFAEKKLTTKLNELLAGKQFLLSRIFLRLANLYVYRF